MATSKPQASDDDAAEEFIGDPRDATRRQARQRAVQILFEMDLRPADAATILGIRESGVGEAVPPYASRLVRGVRDNADRIDELITTYSQGWTLDRMPTVDRQVLRVGVYELLWGDDVPDAVCVDEAVTLARRLSTDSSPRFVNGLLGRLMDLKPSLMLD